MIAPVKSAPSNIVLTNIAFVKFVHCKSEPDKVEFVKFAFVKLVIIF